MMMPGYDGAFLMPQGFILVLEALYTIHNLNGDGLVPLRGLGLVVGTLVHVRLETLLLG